MQELFRIIENPRICSYLPEERAALEVRGVRSMNPAEYGDLLARGYRRFGWQVFRPACPACNACISMRVVVPQFTLSAGNRRILRKNETVRVELHPLFATAAHVNLYNRYQRFMHRHRGWELYQHSLTSYREAFLSGASELGRQWLYFEGERLLGISFMDLAPGAISLVYFFYDPEWRAKSPGQFSILNQLQYARAQGLEYAYFGYWIEACQSMNYKQRFRPHELMDNYASGEPAWRRGE